MPPNALPARWDAHVHVFDAAAPVRPGHYLPAHHPLDEIERLAAAHGVGHLVLVQPSVYGCDNSVLLRALTAGGGRHRGIAVVEPDIDDATLDRLHAAGVRGIRFNLVSPAGQRGDTQRAVRALAPRLRERGWHLQWYAPAQQLHALVALQRETGLRFVLDHLACLGADTGERERAAARELAAEGAWIKFSGWYRLGAVAPYDALHATLAQAAEWFGPRSVWGSDWPHTSFAPASRPDYASTLTPLRAALGEAALAPLLSDHARSLYLETPTP